VIQIREVRPSDAAALAHVLVTANKAAFAGIVPEQCLLFTEEQSAANWSRTLTAGLKSGEFIIVAENGGAVIGYAMGRPALDDLVYRGELKQIHLLPGEQRRGLGRKLVREVARRLAEQGIQSMRVEVLACNPNRPFYERLGARLVSQRIHDWDGVALEMCLYAWTDTRGLMAGAG
jgi:ribosomal protein S18 acetylase RimI-like enzyme